MANSAKKGTAPNAGINYDSILALEALLDIKKSPKLKPVQCQESNISSLPLSEAESQIAKEEEKEIAISLNRSDRDPANNGLNVSHQRKTPNATNGCHFKPLPPSPTLVALQGPPVRIDALPVSNNLKGNVITKPLHTKSSELDHNYNMSKFPIHQLKTSYLTMAPKASSENVPKRALSPKSWIKLQTQKKSKSTPEIPKITGLVPNPLNPKPEHVLSSGGSSNHLSKGEDPTRLATKVPIIRATEVEAALRSKPQRGRKRENLTVDERLELTRTRNREHAKSTRIRKKARYQELLDREKEYEILLKELDLRKKRKECLINFMKLRSGQVINRSWPDQFDFSRTNQSDQEYSASALNEKMEEKSQRAKDVEGQSSFSEGTASKPVDICDSNADTVDFDSLPFNEALNVLLYDPNDFQIFIRTPLHQHHTIRNNGLETLKDHDYALRDLLSKKFGTEVALRIKFTIPQNFLEDMAFSRNGCHVQYNLVASIPRQSNEGKRTDATCFTGLIRANFFPNSHKMTSMEMWSNMDCAHNRDLRSLNSTLSNSPNASNVVICSFPSVVSLDHPFGDHNDHGHSQMQSENVSSKDAEEAKDTQMQNGKFTEEEMHCGMDLDLCQAKSKKG